MEQRRRRGVAARHCRAPDDHPRGRLAPSDLDRGLFPHKRRIQALNVAHKTVGRLLQHPHLRLSQAPHAVDGIPVKALEYVPAVEELGQAGPPDRILRFLAEARLLQQGLHLLQILPQSVDHVFGPLPLLGQEAQGLLGFFPLFLELLHELFNFLVVLLPEPVEARLPLGVIDGGHRSKGRGRAPTKAVEIPGRGCAVSRLVGGLGEIDHVAGPVDESRGLLGASDALEPAPELHELEGNRIEALLHGFAGPLPHRRRGLHAGPPAHLLQR
mmetsp:Transcript_20009/g.57321  ORF Transcript_20009/g.57321 Transcript_20009/m.57321 type:complete len:271 (-) Transcript_20009:1171-1983(-)